MAVLITDSRLEPGAYVSGDGRLYEVLRVDAVSSEVVFEDCRDFTKRRVPVRTVTDHQFGRPSRWQLVKPAPHAPDRLPQ